MTDKTSNNAAERQAAKDAAREARRDAEMEADNADVASHEDAQESADDPGNDLASENAELKDRMLRTLAEMENLRRRTEREIADAKQYAVASFARDMLTVGDNLTRALDAVPDEMRANADDGLKALLEGVDLTAREMRNQLDKHGVRPIDPTGEKFDPNFHQAMFEVPNPQVATGTVVQVMQTGYVIGDRVLRPAMVGVARGGPKAVKTEGGSADPGQTVDKTA